MTTQSRDPYSKDPRIAMIIRVKGLKYIDFFKVTTTAGDHGTIDETRNVKATHRIDVIFEKDPNAPAKPDTPEQPSQPDESGRPSSSDA